MLLEELDRLAMQERCDVFEDACAASGQPMSGAAKNRLMHMLRIAYEGQEQDIVDRLEYLSRRG